METMDLPHILVPSVLIGFSGIFSVGQAWASPQINRSKKLGADKVIKIGQKEIS